MSAYLFFSLSPRHLSVSVLYSVFSRKSTRIWLYRRSVNFSCLVCPKYLLFDNLLQRIQTHIENLQLHWPGAVLTLQVLLFFFLCAPLRPLLISAYTSSGSFRCGSSSMRIVGGGIVIVDSGEKGYN